MLYWACFIINLAVCASQPAPFLQAATSGRSVLSALFSLFFTERAPTTLGGNSPFALRVRKKNSHRREATDLRPAESGARKRATPAFTTKVEAN
jgi:hypothetical protein